VNPILYIDLSPIHGQGVFTSIDLPDGYEIGPICPVIGYGKYFLKCERNIIAKYLNHADEPNAEMFFDVGGIWMRLREDLSCVTEITMNYLGTPNWCQDFLDEEAKRMNNVILLF
jgi:hypothetical protein